MTSIVVYMTSFVGHSSTPKKGDITPSRGIASELDLIPYGEFGRYQSAFDTARRAYFIQSGIESGFSMYRNALNDKAFHLIKDLGLQSQLGVTLLALRIYHEQAVSFPLASNKRITLHPNRFEFRLEW